MEQKTKLISQENAAQINVNLSQPLWVLKIENNVAFC